MAVLLIVEDDTATNEAICEYMRSAGHITLSALDGEQGLQIAREKSVDLVVLDIMLPKRTGLEVLKELRQISNIPILMLTAHSRHLCGHGQRPDGRTAQIHVPAYPAGWAYTRFLFLSAGRSIER